MKPLQDARERDPTSGEADVTSLIEVVENARSAGGELSHTAELALERLVQWMYPSARRFLITRFRAVDPDALAQNLRQDLRLFICSGKLATFIDYRREKSNAQGEVSLWRYLFGGRDTHLGAFLRSRVTDGEYGANAAAMKKAQERAVRHLHRMREDHPCRRRELYEYTRSGVDSPTETWERCDTLPNALGARRERPWFQERRFLLADHAVTMPRCEITPDQKSIEEELVSRADQFRFAGMGSRNAGTGWLIRALFELLEEPFPLRGSTLLSVVTGSVVLEVSYEELEESRSDTGQISYRPKRREE